MTEHRPLSATERHVLDVTVGVYCEWVDKPRSRERNAVLTAIGAIWNRLEWTMIALDELELRVKSERR
jgi:hypothetical protein